MTLRCDDVRDLAPGFVLGALAPAEERNVRDHLGTCREAHDEVDTFGGVVPYLNDSVELVEPPASLKGRVLAAVGAAPQAERSARPEASAARTAAPTLWSDPAVAPDPPREPAARAPARGEPRAVGPGHPTPAPGAPAAAPAAAVGGPRDAAPVVPIAAAPTPIAAQRDSKARRRSPLGWVVAVAAVVAIAALGAWNVNLQGDVRSLRDYDTAVARVLDIAALPGARTAVLRSAGSGRAGGFASLASDGSFAFAVRELPATSGAEVYVAWAVVGERQFPLGSFTVDASGRAGVAGTVSLPGDGVVLGLTREPRPGPTTPTLPMIVTGAATAAPQS